jgi:serine/threonine protein kinase
MSDTSQIFISENDFRNRYQYSQKDLLGEGGFAQVYKAFDRQFKEYVALKFFNKGEEGKYDVLHEMKDSRKFSHKNIIRIHDAFIVKFDHTWGHSLVQVGILEYADGGNLRDFIATTPPESKFLDVLSGILSALEYLHKDKKIIHRDLSPENILMFMEGDNWIPKIADFGISKKVDVVSDVADQQKSALLLGKVSYMAPEQFYPEKFGIHGAINTNVDLWSFGIILYELFTRKKPFGADAHDNPLKIIQSITSDPTPDLNEIPDPYRTVIRKCLEKNANIRVKNAGELIAILNKSPFTSDHKSAATVAITEIEHKKSKSIYLYSGIVLLIVLSVVGYFIWPRPVPHELPDISETQARMISSFIDNEKYYIAIDSIEKLPPEIKSQQIFIDLKNRAKDSITSFRIDSLMNLGDQALSRANRMLEVKDTVMAKAYYDQAIIFYRKINSDYDKADNIAQGNIGRINEIVNSLKPRPVPPVPTPKKPAETQYSFTIDKRPEYEGIDISGIISNETSTIISLELEPTNNPFAIFGPDHDDAYFVRFKSRSGESKLRRIEKDPAIELGRVIKLEKSTAVRMIFDKFPEDVNHFDMIQGKDNSNERILYYHFRDIKIKPKPK